MWRGTGWMWPCVCEISTVPHAPQCVEPCVVAPPAVPCPLRTVTLNWFQIVSLIQLMGQDEWTYGTYWIYFPTDMDCQGSLTSLIHSNSPHTLADTFICSVFLCKWRLYKSYNTRVCPAHHHPPFFWSINTLSSAEVGGERLWPRPRSIQQSGDLWGSARCYPCTRALAI